MIGKTFHEGYFALFISFFPWLRSGHYTLNPDMSISGPLDTSGTGHKYERTHANADDLHCLPSKGLQISDDPLSPGMPHFDTNSATGE